MNQNEYQEAMSELNHYQDLFEQIENSLYNLEHTKTALEAFKEEKSTTALAPIANGVYVETEIKNKDLYVNIGADVVTKKTIKEAVEILEKQKEDVTKDQKKVQKKINELYLKLQKMQGE